MKKFKIMFSLLALVLASPAFASWQFTNNTDGNLWVNGTYGYSYVGEGKTITGWNLPNGEDNINTYWSDGADDVFSTSASTTAVDGMTITANGTCNWKGFIWGYCDNNDNSNVAGSLPPSLDFSAVVAKGLA